MGSVRATHWNTRAMAVRCGLIQTTVSRVWRALGLQPHRTETFKLSPDLLFVDKVRDIVGLYLDPPERALLFCVDEESQIQALDRTQPLLPMRPSKTRVLRCTPRRSCLISRRCSPETRLLVAGCDSEDGGIWRSGWLYELRHDETREEEDRVRKEDDEREHH